MARGGQGAARRAGALVTLSMPVDADPSTRRAAHTPPGGRHGPGRGAIGPTGGTNATPDAKHDHDCATRRFLARRLAALLGLDFAGEYDPSERYGRVIYYVPSDTVVGRDTAAALGICGPQDLFGGVVPRRFVASKAITHRLVDAQAKAPDGWRPGFPQAVSDVVISGFTAFRRDDAIRGGRQLLAVGPVRLKRVDGIGGAGQTVVAGPDELYDVLAGIDDEDLAGIGVVIEENLSEVTTYSVGQVCVAGVVASYWGTQRLTANNRGTEVYGGSDLEVVRGGFDVLLALDLPSPVRTAVAQAGVYDEAAFAHFDGFFASRRNYDVLQGRDAQGRIRSGVLEQSWRIGGASGVEIAALEAFVADPAQQRLRGSSIEVYGDSPPPPAHASVCFRGVDSRVGPLTKYTLIERHADAR